MSDFLYYPASLTTSTEDEVTFFFFQKEESNDYSQDISSKDHEINQHFASIDDSQATSTHLVCTAEAEGDKKEFKGIERVADANKWIEQKWAEYKEIHYPSGVHFDKTKMYLGHVKIGQLRVDSETGILFSEWNQYHHHKFYWSDEFTEKHGNIFFDQLPLIDQSKTQEAKIKNKEVLEKAQAFMLDALDLDRYEADKAKAIEEQTQKAAETAVFLGLKELKGTAKQKKWAEQIRADFLKNCSESAAKKAKRPTTAKYWIDNRNNLAEKLGK